MKALIYVSLLIILLGCSSIPLPDLGTKKVGGKTYVAERSTLLGKPIGGPKWIPIVTKGEKLTEKMSRPAEIVLWIAVPSAILSVAAMLFLTGSPLLMKRFGTIAALSMVAAVLASAWLALSMWPLVSIPLIIAIIVVLYAKSKGRSWTWLSLD